MGDGERCALQISARMILGSFAGCWDIGKWFSGTSRFLIDWSHNWQTCYYYRDHCCYISLFVLSMLNATTKRKECLDLLSFLDTEGPGYGVAGGAAGGVWVRRGDVSGVMTSPHDRMIQVLTKNWRINWPYEAAIKWKWKSVMNLILVNFALSWIFFTIVPK